MSGSVTGRVNAVQTLGTLDGPGVRFVAFLQGCPLRCACCHNPETWDPIGGEEYTAAQLVKEAERYRAYFGARGGITLSGGEPLLQPDFTAAVFRLCRERGIHTCLDTSGTGCSAPERVLEQTDYCLLDVKYATDELYKKYTGSSIVRPKAFLEQLERRHIPTRIRQVTIPGLNDTQEQVEALVRLTEPYTCIIEWELLPFRTLCREKYDRLGIEFRLADTPEPSAETMARLRRLLPRRN